MMGIRNVEGNCLDRIYNGNDVNTVDWMMIEIVTEIGDTRDMSAARQNSLIG